MAIGSSPARPTTVYVRRTDVAFTMTRPTTSSTIVVVEDEDRAVDNPSPDDCKRGLGEARDLAQKIVLSEGDPMHLANAICWAGWNNGGFAGPSDDPICPELNEVGACSYSSHTGSRRTR